MAKVPPASKYDTGLVTLRRSTVVGALSLGALVASWAGAATWYVVSKDSFAAHMVNRETARQYVYEDRIATLKSEIDKLMSRQLIDQDGVEARVAELVTRQTQIENRQAIVAALADGLSGGQLAAGRPLRPSAAAQAATSVPLASSPAPLVTGSVSSFAPSSRPMPVPEMPGLRRDSERRPAMASGWDQSALEPPASLPERLQHVERQLQRMAASQLQAIQRMEAAVSGAHASLRSVVNDIGLDPDKLANVPRGGAQGGPFVPAQIDPRHGPFEASVVRLQPKIAQVERLRATVTQLPIRRPMPAEFEQTSGFGHRVDPFTRGLAMHTGIDFRAETGTPVRPSGSGTVITAEHSGGYGNMVEIDHGHGLTTRYAHLSSIAVSEGQQVTPATIIGRVGSTGRSTGPHLHYETRLEGDAVDPTRFIRAGSRFFQALNGG